VSTENFPEGRGQKEHQDREIAPISFLPFYQWWVKGHTGHAPGITSTKCCTKRPA